MLSDKRYLINLYLVLLRNMDMDVHIHEIRRIVNNIIIINKGGGGVAASHKTICATSYSTSCKCINCDLIRNFRQYIGVRGQPISVKM